MDNVKLFESELKLMELLWKNEGVPAKELTLLAFMEFGWNKNTTYTVIKRLVSKGAIRRDEPGFICRSLIGREEVGREEAKAVVDSFFGGSVQALFSSFVAEGVLPEEDIEELRLMIDAHGQKD